jgi:RNA-directed DNA polymerase
LKTDGQVRQYGADATAVMVDVATFDTSGGVLNGPEELLDWDAVNWRHTEAQVQRLRQRIFKATQAGDLKKVRNLQKLMLRSLANVQSSRIADSYLR